MDTTPPFVKFVGFVMTVVSIIGLVALLLYGVFVGAIHPLLALVIVGVLILAAVSTPK